MGFFDDIFGNSDSSEDGSTSGIIDYGNQKKDGGHNHQTNKDEDRTPAQKAGDAKRKK